MSGPTVLLLSHDLGGGGAQRKIADVARYLTSDASSKTVTAYVAIETPPPSDPDARAIFDAVSASSVRVRIRPPGVPFPIFCAWCVLTLRPTRIVGFLRGPGILAVMLRRLFWWRDIRVGISDDSYPSGAVAEQTRGTEHASVIRALVRWGYGMADWVAAASEAARADLITTFEVPAERVVVSRNWFGHDGAESAEHGGSVVRRAGVPDAGFDVIYVGRLVPVKNLGLFMEVVRDLREVRPNVRAVIVGGGPELAALERQRTQYGLEDHVVFTGWQRDVRPWLASSRVFCLTSHHEGAPIAVLEAMALGLPVVSTRYPGADELVRDGETGFLCRDRTELAEGVLRCLGDDALRATLGRQARAMVAARYGADNLREFVELIVRG